MISDYACEAKGALNAKTDKSLLVYVFKTWQQG
jgi:hypothetical protein